ncbi:helix-turn-helix transcriptional regulator [Flavobacterium sp. MMLR14_040]|uniref:helix-turn-helix domain-containing protein n=1 Tax=Flavobacterium sp. MMLR14_040 TaxID=3093843 RepID=UPI00298FE6DB|nr:helix-turn-helix transcriptional regulator [Flavobacterium sp. MMLR14_040]MDW8848646.1 helix-turn-helix transcriptional regulator [Flavobacterium sp. MMLR14_040]
MDANDFKAFKIENLDTYTPSFGRKDLYRICLVYGKSTVHFRDKSMTISGTYLFFGNINTPYSWETESEQSGYSCLFTENFLKVAGYFDNTELLSIFNIEKVPVYEVIGDNEKANIKFIFERILEESNGQYPKRKDLVRNFISILIHEALKLNRNGDNPAAFTSKKASERISSKFLNLLNEQFPIEDKNCILPFKTVAEFARQLNVHPNYLNRLVKRETGKTILKIINERIVTESKILLLHTDWTITEIACTLGFEYTSYFDNVFKKTTGLSPKLFRKTN